MVGCNSAPQAGLGIAPAPALDPFTERRLARERSARGSGARMRCVSSGYLSGGCSCGASVPAEVASAAWADEQRAGLEGDRFFQFSWRGEAWLGFGVEGSGVRGVYCPAHNAQRSERSFMQLLARSSSAAETETLTAA